MFIYCLRAVFPTVPVTESHPKAVLKVVAKGSWATFSESYGLQVTPTTEHARDALIAAVGAREGFEERWTDDLAKTRLTGEQDPSSYWLGPVHYYWPEK